MAPWTLILLAAARALAAPTLLEAPAADAAAARAAKIPLVLRWQDGPAEVQAEVGGTWKRLGLGDDTFTTRPLAVGTALRLVRDGQPGEPLRAPGVWTPADIAGWSGPGLAGARAVVIEEQSDRLWVGTLGAGVALWDGAAWTPLHRRHGLPGDLAIDLDAEPDATWVATDGGLARIEDSVTDTWDAREGLPDSYSQAVHVQGDQVWVGTYRGLARLRGDKVDVVLSPASCFSLLTGPDRRPWVGYQGLRGLPDGEPIEGVDPGLRVYDAEPDGTGVWLATDDLGVLWLEDGLTRPALRPPHRAAFGLAKTPHGLVVAAGEDGVWRNTAVGFEPHHQDEGLPSPVANTVAPGPRGKAWVGTERGVALLDPEHAIATALPLAPLPAGLAVRAVAPGKEGMAVIGDPGLRWLGDKPPRGFSGLSAAVGTEGLDVLEQEGHWWALLPDAALHLDPKGELSRWALHSPARGLVRGANATGIVTDRGLQWWRPGATQLSAVTPLPGAQAAWWGHDGGLWIAGGEAVTRLGVPEARTWHNIPGPREVATSASAAWIAAKGGLYSIDSRGDVTPRSKDWRPGPLVAVSVSDNDVWTAGEDGRLWGPDPSAPGMVDLELLLPGVQITALHAVPGGVWVATHRGLFYVDARTPR